MSKLNQWMAGLVEENGVDIFPGFAGVEVLYEESKVIGVRTGDKGIDAKGEKKSNYEPGADVQARVTVFGEGSRGNLTKELIADSSSTRARTRPGSSLGSRKCGSCPRPGWSQVR